MILIARLENRFRDETVNKILNYNYEILSGDELLELLKRAQQIKEDKNFLIFLRDDDIELFKSNIKGFKRRYEVYTLLIRREAKDEAMVKIPEKYFDVIVLENDDKELFLVKLEAALRELYRRWLKKHRMSWDEYFMKVAMVVAERSNCLRHHIGAIAVKNRRIISTGYNGPPTGFPNCTDVGCIKDKDAVEKHLKGMHHGTSHDLCPAIHAEQNMIIQASLHGVSLRGATVYCTHTPCNLCARMLVNAGIKEYVTFSDYYNKEFLKIFKSAGITFRKIKKPEQLIRFLK